MEDASGCRGGSNGWRSRKGCLNGGRDAAKGGGYREAASFGKAVALQAKGRGRRSGGSTGRGAAGAGQQVAGRTGDLPGRRHAEVCGAIARGAGRPPEQTLVSVILTACQRQRSPHAVIVGLLRSGSAHRRIRSATLSGIARASACGNLLRLEETGEGSGKVMGSARVAFPYNQDVPAGLLK